MVRSAEGGRGEGVQQRASIWMSLGSGSGAGGGDLGTRGDCPSSGICSLSACRRSIILASGRADGRTDGRTDERTARESEARGVRRRPMWVTACECRAYPLQPLCMAFVVFVPWCDYPAPEPSAARFREESNATRGRRRRRRQPPPKSSRFRRAEEGEGKIGIGGGGGGITSQHGE